MWMILMALVVLGLLVVVAVSAAIDWCGVTAVAAYDAIELAEILEANFSKIVVAKDEDAVRDAIAETGAALREFYREAL